VHLEVAVFKKMIRFDQVGLITFGLKIFRLLIIYNVSYFAFTTFLGSSLGYGIQVKDCGPWAGNPIKHSLIPIKIVCD